MKVVFNIGSLDKGGAERVVVNLANYLSKKNEIFIMCTKISNIEYEINKNVKIINLSENINKENFLIRNFKIIFRMKKKLTNINPDINIVFLKEPTTRCLFLKMFSKKIRKIPLIVSVRSDPKRLYKKIREKIFIKIFYNKAEGFVFQTEQIKSFFSAKIQNKSVIIENAINPKFLKLNKTDLSENRIVCIGRFEKQKNQKLLIDAFYEICNLYPEYTLEFYGDGSLKDEMINHAQNMNISEKVLFHGNKNNIENCINNVKLFVLTSDFEGMPNALLEAMSLGIPSISTDCDGGGPAVVINSDINGILISKNNKIELKNSIIKILSNKSFMNKLSTNAFSIRSVYSEDKINIKWEKYIYSLIKNKESNRE